MDNENIPSNDDSQNVAFLSHKDIMTVAENNLNYLIDSDPLLKTLPTSATLEELNSLLALEHGRAMNITVWRGDNAGYSIVVDQDALILDLKKAIRYHFTMKQKRKGIKQLISWKYIWKKYWLYFEGQKLTPDHCKLKDFGVRNGADLTFIKRLRS